MKTVGDYQDLVTSEHQDKPNFLAMIALGVSPLVQIQTVLRSMISLFDLDLPPVGQQLDFVGAWVGISREVGIPIFNVYFQWDGSDQIGWEFGVWQPADQPVSLTVLPDDAYLTLIKAKIAANYWDGTTEGVYRIWDFLFPNLPILIQDNQNMSFLVAIPYYLIDSLTLALLIQGSLPLRPEGVEIVEYVIAVDANPLFGWDLQNIYIDGWGAGSWGKELKPI